MGFIAKKYTSSVIVILLGYYAVNFRMAPPNILETKQPKLHQIAMVFVEGGSFNMGSEEYDNDASPVHKVKLSSFYIGKYEVTNAEWIAVMGKDTLYHKEDNPLPVVRVNWDDVQAFIKKLNIKTGKHYRLPTEAEWEYAARGGNKSHGFDYSGSNDSSKVSWFVGNNGQMTHPVGQKQPNELGTYDMSGNAWEWCQDLYYRNYYYSDSTVVNPLNLTLGSDRVVRGGGLASLPICSRVARRDKRLPNARSESIGFRLAMEP